MDFIAKDQTRTVEDFIADKYFLTNTYSSLEISERSLCERLVFTRNFYEGEVTNTEYMVFVKTEFYKDNIFQSSVLNIWTVLVSPSPRGYELVRFRLHADALARILLEVPMECLEDAVNAVEEEGL